MGLPYAEESMMISRFHTVLGMMDGQTNLLYQYCASALIINVVKRNTRLPVIKKTKMNIRRMYALFLCIVET